MRFAVTAIVAVVLGAGTWLLMANSHVDIFPCEKTEYDLTTHKVEGPKSATCSLIDFKPSHISEGESVKLTAAGYAVEAVVVGVIPLVIGFVVGSRVGRKKAA